MIGICLLSGTLAAFVPAERFTLAWTHSIEKQRWEEDWQIQPADLGSQGDTKSWALALMEARVRGSGAGMEPPAGAELRDGVWHYRVSRVVETLKLTHSAYAAPYELCTGGHCRPLADHLPGLEPQPAEAVVVTLRGCRQAP